MRCQPLRRALYLKVKVMKNVIDILARRKAREFMCKYTEDSRGIFVDGNGKLIHKSEFGEYRERIVKELLSCFLPTYYKFGEGFIVDRSNERTTQCDVVIYNGIETPRIETDDLRRFYPIETVYSIGEVKSKLSKTQLKEALLKLMEVKKIRNNEPVSTMPINPFNEDLTHEKRHLEISEPEYRNKCETITFWNPSFNEFQNVVSFLVCESINFGDEDILDVIADIYPPSIADASRRHNFILSIEDGFISYNTSDDNDKLVPYNFPNRGEIATSYRFVEPSDEGDHILAFLSSLVDAVSKNCIYKFDICSYVGSFKEKNAPMR